MKRKIELWLKQRHQRQQLRRLQCHYRTLRSLDSLQLFPLHLALRTQLRSLADTRADRPRKDGLKPGTPEALAADREKNRVRMEKVRAAQRAQPSPPPLPSAGTNGAGNLASAPGEALAPMPGIEGAPVVPWDPEMLKPVFAELIPVAEEMTIHQVVAKAAKARLPGDLIKEIEADAKWNEFGKKGLELSAPEVTAEMLNEMGISAKNKHRVILATSIGTILAGHIKLLRRLDKLIAVANAPTTKPEDKKP